jgi:hypothetical protein
MLQHFLLVIPVAGFLILLALFLLQFIPFFTFLAGTLLLFFIQTVSSIYHYFNLKKAITNNPESILKGKKN